MGDSDLDAIRQRRMAELQAGAGGGGEQAQQEEARRQQQMDMKNGMLAQIMTQEARARLNTIAMMKPEKAQMVENHLISMARSGQVMGKINEDQLKSLLEKVSEQTQKKTVVNYDRRRTAIDSDDD